jgi:flagellar biosynthesis protein FlhF
MMRLKSYFAGTVESAICLARQEMGEEAMLVSSRKTPPEAKHLGVYEVVFAAAHDMKPEVVAPTRPARTEEPFGAGLPSATTPQNLANELAEMRRQVAKMSTLVSRSAVRNGLRASTATHPALDELEELLSANEVDGDLVCSILRALEILGPVAAPTDMIQAFHKDIQGRLTVSAELSPWSFDAAPGPGASAARRIVVLVGPPGAGKTTMLAKLAVRFGVSARRSTHIISYDGHRIGTGEQLRSYAAILGVSFEAIDTVGAFAQSLKENSRKDIVLVDTPGYSETDFDLSWELRRFLSTYPLVDIHLVLSCGAKSSDISRMVDRYTIFNPAKLLFTRLDETESFGVILNESARTRLPVSFLGTGPRVPDDFEPATGDRIANLLLEGRESRSVAMA